MKTSNNFPFYSLFKNLFLIGSDSFAYISSLFLAIYIRKLLPIFLPYFNFPDFFYQSHITSEIHVLLVILIVVFIWNNLYQTRYSFWEELFLIWQSLMVAGLISYVFLFNFDITYISRVVVFLLFLILIVILPFYRFILKKILFKLSFWKTPMVIVCKCEDLSYAFHIAQVFRRDFYLGFVPIAFLIEDAPEEYSTELPIFRDKTQIPFPTTLCIIGDLVNNQHWFAYFYSRYRKIYTVPNTASLGLKGSGVQYLFTERLFILKIENKLNSYFTQFVKNTMDRILGGFLVLLLCPVFLIIALIIKTKSSGSVFYRQKRVGKGGAIFYMWKFRTMYQDADQRLQELLEVNPILKQEWDTYFKLKCDPRITPIGNFLRRYSLDEFPQLFNVLAGEMSLVGPRPFVPGEIQEENPILTPLYEQVKPGLTGLWQISGRNQFSRSERIDVDIWYIQHWSLSLDLLILLNTPLAVISGKGAS
ncbi:MAG: exopolysaccharide biosynthesis polyprenyl glycosylphosphotransferase [Brevinema sp.]